MVGLGRFALAWAIASGCNSATVIETAVDGSQTILLVQLSASAAEGTALGSFDVFRATPAGDLPFGIVSIEPLDGRHLVYLQESLEEVGLTEQSYELESATCGTRILPAPAGARRLDRTGTEVLTAEAIPEALQTIRVEAPSALAPGQPFAYSVVAATRAVPLHGPDRQIYFQVNSAFQTLDLDRLSDDVTIVGTSTVPLKESDELTAQYRHPSGLMILGAASGDLYCGRIGEEFARLQGPNLRSIRRITGTRSASDPFDVWVTTSADAGSAGGVSGAIWRLRADEPSCGVQFEEVIAPMPVTTQFAKDHAGVVVHVGPGKIFAFPHNGVAVIWENGAVVERLKVDASIADAIFVEDIGVIAFDRDIALTGDTRMFVFDFESGTPLHASLEPFPVATRRAVPSGRGTVLVFGGRGHHAEFVPTRFAPPGPTWCNLSRLPIEESPVTDLVAREREIVLTTGAALPGDPPQQRTTITILPLSSP